MNKKTNRRNVLSLELIDKIKLIAKKGVSFAQGDVLFKEGDHKEYIYLIETGEIALIKDKQQQKVEIMSQNEGDIVGIDLIFNDRDCEYSALVIQPSVVYRVLISDFVEFLANNSASSLELMKYLSSLITKLETRKLA